MPLQLSTQGIREAATDTARSESVNNPVAVNFSVVEDEGLFHAQLAN